MASCITSFLSVTVFTEKILKQNGIFELFDQIVGANLDGSMTDKTEVMQEAMRRAGGSPLLPARRVPQNRSTRRCPARRNFSRRRRIK